MIVIIRDVEDPEHGYRTQVLVRTVGGPHWVRVQHLGELQPYFFKTRVHARQWLQSRPAGWWLSHHEANKAHLGRPRFLPERLL